MLLEGATQVLRQHVPSPLPQLFACSESVETDHPTQNRVQDGSWPHHKYLRSLTSKRLSKI